MPNLCLGVICKVIKMTRRKYFFVLKIYILLSIYTKWHFIKYKYEQRHTDVLGFSEINGFGAMDIVFGIKCGKTLFDMEDVITHFLEREHMLSVYDIVSR